MIINFEDQAKLDNIPDDQPKQMMPVLLTYSERKNRDGTSDTLRVFFSVSTKWESTLEYIASSTREQ